MGLFPFQWAHCQSGEETPHEANHVSWVASSAATHQHTAEGIWQACCRRRIHMDGCSEAELDVAIEFVHPSVKRLRI